MTDYKFNLTVQSWVERILVQNPNTGKTVCEMTSVIGVKQQNGKDGKRFNGTILARDVREAYSSEFTLRLLGDEGILEVSVQNLLSIPITEIQDPGAGVPEQHNFIVVNDDPEGDAQACLVQFSARFVENMNVPEEIELTQKPCGQLKKDWEAKNVDLLARGVDPKTQNFISSIVLYPSDKNVMDILDDLNKEIVIIKIYGIDIHKELTVKID